MAITNRHVKQLERITGDLGDLVQQMHPGTIKEWDVFDGAVTAHKHLRKLDTDSLRQLELPLPGDKAKTPAARQDCPRCGGEGEYLDPTDGTATSRQCSCMAVEEEAWPNVKADWEKLLQPAEV